MKKTCYMCSEQETSREHVPPRCFFPKAKDSEEKNYRANLIKVPSCDEHNTEKSAIDEYLRQIIVMHYKNNTKSQSHGMQSILRAFTKQPGKLVNLQDSSSPVSLNGLETFTIETDLDKFNLGISHMAHGIYYYKHKEAWPHTFQVHTLEFLGDDAGLRARKAELVSNFNHILSITEFEGENQDVFKFRHYVEKKINMALFHLVFYEGFNVYAYSSAG